MNENKKTSEVKNMSQVEQKTVNKHKYQLALDAALKFLAIPDGYQLKDVRSGKHNAFNVWIYRYEKANNEIGGEHYSFTVDKESYRRCL